jgi:hypothetical protein
VKKIFEYRKSVCQIVRAIMAEETDLMYADLFVKEYETHIPHSGPVITA